MATIATTGMDAPMIDFDFKTGWLTLNRTCNLRCKWCYARDTEYKSSLTMSKDLAFELIDFFDSINVKHIILIGGEPTIHPDFFEILEYAKEKKVKCALVTNGLMFKNDEFIDKYKSMGMNRVSLSLKGEDEKTYKEITGFDGFQETIDIIKKLVSSDISVSVSMVLTENNMNSFTDVIPTLLNAGAKRFHFSFCYDFNLCGVKKGIFSPISLLEMFGNIYEKLNSLTNGHFTLQNGLPLCYWDKTLLRKMINRKQISTVCQLLTRKGLIFDSEGYHIPCNAMYALKLGKFGEDFRDPSSFKQYLNSEVVQNTYQKLCGVPDENCLHCNKLVHCGGGCVCQYTNYKLKDYLVKQNKTQE
ncbi:MAG: radical SAM protein [Mollicutes bacterium]|nr:radical SAM protein [Mollicutes bacterium]